MEVMRYRVKLDMEDSGTLKTQLRLKQGDSAITLVFKIMKNGIDVYSASDVPTVVFKRSDGTSVVGNMSVAEGQYTYTMAGNELQIAGPMTADVKFDVNTARESTCTFGFECVPDTMSPDTNPAGIFVNSLKDIINAVQQGVEKVEQAAATLDMQEIIDIKNEIQALVDRLPDFTIDSEMSDTSEHALQNKVITNAINRIDEILESVELTGKASSISITTNNKLAEVIKLGGLSNKVTVDGTTSLESNPIVEVKSASANLLDINSAVLVGGVLGIPINFMTSGSTYTFSANKSIKFKVSTGYADISTIEKEGASGTFTAPSNLALYAFIKANNAWCKTIDELKAIDLQVESGSAVSAYAPYMTDHYTIPTESRQKLIDMGYGLGISDSLYNSLEFNKKYHNMKSVDLGTLNWQYTSSNKCFFAEIADSKESNTCILLCKEYSNSTDWTTFVASDKVSRHDTTGKAIEIRDLSCTTVDQLKVRVSGLIMHYEAESGGQDYKAIVYRKKCGEVDLGSLTWTYDSNVFYSNKSDIKKPASNSEKSTILSAKYNTDTWNTMYTTNGDIGVGYTGNIGIRDTAYTSASTFKSAMNGVKAVYELATPQIYDVTDILQSDNIVEIEKGGTLSFIDSSGVAKAVPYEVKLLGTSDATVKLNAILKGNEKEDADNSIIGDAWTSSKTYAVGEYCISADKLWKCKVQHTNVIPSEGTYWTCVSVTDEIGTLNTSFSTKTNNNFGTEVNIPLDTDFTCPSDGLVQYGGYSTSVTQIYINGALYSSIYGGAQAGASIWNNARVNKNDVVKIIDYNSSNASNVHRFYPTT